MKLEIDDGYYATKRNTSHEIEEIIGDKLPVLNDGFVRVIDYMGNDEAVVQAARVSYGKGTKSVSDDRSLINYLMRHKHTSPFEMCEIFHYLLH
jgi:thymidylate synthase (FAD)